MTKRIALFALLLVAAMGLQAQSIVGTWKTSMMDDGQKMDFYFVFTQSTLTMKGTMTQHDPEVGTITVSVKVPGTYTRSGNTLNVKTAPSQAKLSIDKMDFVGELAQLMKQSPEMKKMLEDQVQKAMEGSKGEIVSGFPKSGQITIVQNTGTKLLLRDETGETLNFTKVR